MIRPRPCTYSCPRCGWSKYVAPASDALGPGEFFEACPKCSGQSLEKTVKDGFLQAVKVVLKRIKRQ